MGLIEIMTNTEAGSWKLSPVMQFCIGRMSGVMDTDEPLSSISLSSYRQACSTTRISVAEMECYYHLLGVCQETAALKSTYTSLKCLYLCPATSRVH